MKACKLIMITPDNNNKFYNIKDLENGTFEVEYGRVGSTAQVRNYPIKELTKKYNEKIKKGYKDVSELFIEENTTSKLTDVKDLAINELVNKLMNYSKKQVTTNYNISVENVTEKQINEAQKLINNLCSNTNKDTGLINSNLIDLYSIIPRKMSNVKNHLLSTFDTELFNNMIDKEQKLLDSMRVQVKTSSVSKSKDNEENDILTAMGLEIREVTLDEEEHIKQLMGDIKNKYSKAFKVVNSRTQKEFDKLINLAYNKYKLELFHGSRSENWWSIIDTGLLIRPSSAVYTGSMFGDGIYYADKARKSLGYTSLSGSYWVRGSSKEGFMAVYDVHLGKQYDIHRHTRECYNLSEKTLESKGNFNSVFAHGGADLRNNEFIIYNSSQCTIKYLIQLKE